MESVCPLFQRKADYTIVLFTLGWRIKESVDREVANPKMSVLI